MPARALPPRQDDALAELGDLVLAMDPAELEAFVLQLAPVDRYLIERVLADRAAAGWRADPATMRNRLDPTYELRAYVRFLARKWVELCDNTGRRMIWNLPGRYGKTALVQAGLAWLLDRKPGSQSIYVTHGQQLANETGIAVRDLLREHRDVLRAQLRVDRRERRRFVTTEDGGLLVVGLGGVPYGFGVGRGGVLVVDDPFKHWAEAHSEARRKYVVEQFKGTLRNRLDDERSGILVVHHRLHTEDLTGKLKADMEAGTGEEWEMVVLPALAAAPQPGRVVPGYPDPLGRAPGEALDPDRFPAEAVAQRAKAVGSHLAAALEDQDPQPDEGGEIKRAWFDLIDAGQLPPAYDQELISWDLKLKDREAGDYVVGQVWGRTGSDYWLRDQLRGQYDHATTGNAIALLSVRHPGVTLSAIEAAGSADEVVPQLRKPRKDYVVSAEMAGRLGMTEAERDAVQALRRRGMSGLVFHPVTEGSKPVRARTFIVPAAEGGSVHVVVAHWTPHYLDEMAGFPGGHDDQVDATSQALQRLGVGTASLRPAGRAPVQPAVAPPPQAPQARRGQAQAAVLLPARRRR